MLYTQHLVAGAPAPEEEAAAAGRNGEKWRRGSGGREAAGS